MYTIPNTFQFIYTGNGISNYFPNLAQWRNLHPEHAIHLWIAPETMKPEEVTATRHMAKTKNIQLHDINKEVTLKNHEYILKEISKGNPWSTSDILRISILLQQPGFYFDINVTPRKALPTDLTCEQGALFEKIIRYEGTNTVGVGLKILASAYQQHPIFDQSSQLIPINFELLNREGKLQEKISNLSKSFGLNPSYMFANLVTASVFITSLLSQYQKPSQNPILDIVTDAEEMKSLTFDWECFLNIAIPQNHSSSYRNLEKDLAYQILAKQFENEMASASYYKKIENSSLVDRLNNLCLHSLLFFSNIDKMTLMVSAVSKLETADQEKRADQLSRELRNAGCSSRKFYIGKDRFFTIPNINIFEYPVGTKLQDFLKKRNA